MLKNLGSQKESKFIYLFTNLFEKRGKPLQVKHKDLVNWIYLELESIIFNQGFHEYTTWINVQDFISTKSKQTKDPLVEEEKDDVEIDYEAEERRMDEVEVKIKASIDKTSLEYELKQNNLDFAIGHMILLCGDLLDYLEKFDPPNWTELLSNLVKYAYMVATEEYLDFLNRFEAYIVKRDRN